MSKNKFESNKKYFTLSIYAFFVIAASMLFYKFIINWNSTSDFFNSLLKIISPFLIAFLIAFLLNPAIKLINNKMVSRIKIRKFSIKSPKTSLIISIIITYIIFVGLIIIIMLFIVPEVANSVAIIIKEFPTIDQITEFIENLISDIYKKYPSVNTEEIKQEFSKYIPNAINQLYPVISKNLPSLLTFSLSFSMSLISGLLNFVLALVIAFYLIVEKDGFLIKTKKIMYAYFSKNKANKIIEILNDCNTIFAKFVVGKAIDSLIIGILCFIIISIAKIPYPLLISVIVGITNMIPYFGPFIGAVPGVLIVLVNEPVKAIWFTIIIFGLQQFDGLFLGPKILGDSTGLSPFWIIFSIIIGGALFGVIGMFLGVPIIAVLNYLFNILLNKKIENQNLIDK